MKKTLLVFPLALSLLSIAGCSGSGQKDSKPEIEDFEIAQVIKTADRNYRLEMEDGDTAYLDVYTSLQWPTKLGKADLSVLQDSIIGICYSYSDTVKAPLNELITTFLGDTTAFKEMLGAKRMIRVDSIPDGDNVRSYFISSTASVVEITEDMATYQVTLSSYLGGAHPYTAIYPFTYELDSARVMKVDDILTPAGVDSIMPVIRTSLARQLEVPVDALDRAGIFTSQLTTPGQPYISGNVLYFHYNPYEIAPYSAGMIDVAVYPYEVQKWLKPMAKELLDGNF